MYYFDNYVVSDYPTGTIGTVPKAYRDAKLSIYEHFHVE